MEPPGGVPPDRDREKHTAIHASQQPQQHKQLVPLQQAQRPSLTLNLPLPHQSLTTATIATSPAAALIAAANAASSSNNTIVNNPALASAAIGLSATTQAATAFSGSSVGPRPHTHEHHHHHHHQHGHQQSPRHAASQQQNSSASSSILGGMSSSSGSSGQQQQQQTIEKLSRPMAFDKMEALVREMQDPEHGVPVRQQKMFLTSIPYAFMGYDLIEWLMDRLLIEESEALNIANQLCLHGYFFPVNDTKTLTVKDDSSLYRFQTPYYWPWQHKAPDNVEYAIYLAKRSLRNKQRHALEDYEAEALASLHKNLKGKWDFISMQAEEQVRLAKERKKGDKIVGDSQERAFWRVHRPPPGQFTPLEPCPIPSRDRQGAKPNKKKTLEDVQREVDYLKKSLNRTRMKMSQACESLVSYSETFAEYDFFLQPVLPSNPWVTEDITFWQLNNTFVDIPTEKRVRRWAISIEELVCDPTGLQEFTSFLEKEYSHENIRFWIAVNRLRRSAHSQVVMKVNDIYEEFLKPGAPCEINIDGKTMESVLKGLKSPSRFTFDAASEHIYMLLLKKDCYPRFIRSDHYKRLLETGIQPSHKKRFFNFGGVTGAKKKMTAALSNQADAATSKGMMPAPPPGSLARRRGSDRSLTGSAHELAVIGVNKDATSKVPHSHSQSNLSEIPSYSDTVYRGDMPHTQRHMLAMDVGTYAAYGLRESSLHTHPETPKSKAARLETTVESASSSVCPWDSPDKPPTTQAPTAAQAIASGAQVKLNVCPWEQDSETGAVTLKAGTHRLSSTSSDNSDVCDRSQRNLAGIRHQNTVDSGEAGMKRLIPNFTEQRRASVSFTPSRIAEYQFGRPTAITKSSTTPSPTVGILTAACATFSPLNTSSQAQETSISEGTDNISRSSSIITKDPASSTSDADIEEELHKLTIAERSSESPELELPTIPTPAATPTPTPPPITKITPPPPPNDGDNATNTDNTQEGTKVIARSELEVGETEGAGSGAESETEVASTVQEVHIELIETSQLMEGSKSPQPLLERATPTIQIEEPVNMAEQSPKSPTLPKSPVKLYYSSDAVVEVEEVASDILTKPTRQHSSATSSPEKIFLEEKSVVPPPLPEIGPMEEEEKFKEEEVYIVQEELSPTTEEYQEYRQFDADSKDAYEYDIVDTDTQSGYIPPAPTPAPSMAPLAEMDVDTVEEDYCEELKQPTAAPVTETPAVNIVASVTITEEVKKKHKKRNSHGKKMSSLEEKDKEKASTSAAGAATQGGAKAADADRNTVCPWEDENLSTSDGTFVKTYATLGYL